MGKYFLYVETFFEIFGSSCTKVKQKYVIFHIILVCVCCIPLKYYCQDRCYFMSKSYHAQILKIFLCLF